MFHTIEKHIQELVSSHIRSRYGIEIQVAVESPKQPEFGELALPVAFQLAKQLKRAPKQIAAEMAADLGALDGVTAVEVAGNGYLNLRLDRARYGAALLAPAAAEPEAAAGAEKIIVEHTNINPNKAAHIGHLRNAVLGDTFVRMLRARGRRVEVQNYIDNTGVQVADVVVGFRNLEGRTPEQVEQSIASGGRFDYLCWDLYARTSAHYTAAPEALQWRRDTLHEIEAGVGEAARLAHAVSDAIVAAHLKTMLRLGIVYDVLPRESEILHLKFWATAFELLKERRAIYLETEGKNAGCWVMPGSAFSGAKGLSKNVPKQPLADARGSASGAESASALRNHDRKGVEENIVQQTPKPAANETESPDEMAETEDSKVIVRSNGTVTYVGKDIAYQLWKFGLLGKDFYYRLLLTYPNGHPLWVTTDQPCDSAASFGRGSRVYNVIDSRQSYLQDVVVAGLRALGFDEQAARSVHFSYEMVALSPRCCAELGIALSEEDRKRPYVEVSGRKGLGVKADALIDKLIEEALREVASRHPEDAVEKQKLVATQIAIGALRYFLLKFTRNSVIAFDFQEALSFEGETGPYVQYAAVRARNIWRKLAERGEALPDFTRELTPEAMARQFESADFWQLALAASKTDSAIEHAAQVGEPAHVAKFAFQLAQAFNNFYHEYPVLSEENRERKVFLLWLTGYLRDQLERTLIVLGIEVPEYM
ncbi:MAG: arginine--tRNA ligase [Bryobacteraceae bacterium]